jgi:SAM-dependent methyltransferase
VPVEANEEPTIEFVEYVAQTLDVGPGTTVFEVACGAGAFLLPLHANGYLVGGLDPDSVRIEEARAAMPGGRFTEGSPLDLDPSQPWQVVICRAFESFPDAGYARGVLARMAAKATHAVAILDIPEDRFDRRWMLRAFAEIGVSAVQMEAMTGDEGKEARYNVFARL